MSIQLLALGGLIGLGGYYYVRANRLTRMKLQGSAPDTASESKGEKRQLTHSKYPYTTMSKRLMDPTVWGVVDGTYSKEGEFGLERRDHVDCCGTRTVTYTDMFNNV